MQKKVLALHDLSGFGRSSLVPIIAAISAAGHQCVPLPTAYFSTHMAIPGWETVDLTGVMPRVIDQYDRLGLRFESVYAGFLGSADQIDCVRDAVLRLKSENGTAFIDPVMGDNGEVYATYTPEMCTRMRELCEIADIITPNTTEAAILVDRDPASAPQNETEAQEWLHALHSRYGAQVVLTGLDYEPGKVGSGCLSAMAAPSACTRGSRSITPGTGDLFAAVVLGALRTAGRLPMPVRSPASSSRTASPTPPRSIPTLCMACNLRSCCRAFFLATRTGLRYNIDRFSDIPR